MTYLQHVKLVIQVTILNLNSLILTIVWVVVDCLLIGGWHRVTGAAHRHRDAAAEVFVTIVTGCLLARRQERIRWRRLKKEIIDFL